MYIYIMNDFMTISDARAKLPEVVSEVNKGKEKITITVNGKPKAVVVSSEYLESLEETAEILAIPGEAERIKKGMKEAAEGKGIPLSDLK